MGWVEDNKGQGPWAFVEQPNRPNYNEGNLISSYDNPLWQAGEFSGVPITPTHDPCGYWTKNYTPPPSDPYLIAWYKFDEGSGTVVYNHATDGSGGGGLLPDLAVVLGKNLFWSSLAGFGSATGNGNPDCAWNKPDRDIGPGGVAFGGFFRIGETAFIASGGCFDILDGGQSRIQIAPAYPYYTGLNLHWAGLYEEIFFTYLDKWIFIFMASDGKWRIAQDDGTVLVGSITVVETDIMAQFTFLRFGFTYANADPPTIVYSPSQANYGDWILYSGTTLTIAEWAVWYDKLRLRYGMVSRSGW